MSYLLTFISPSPSIVGHVCFEQVSKLEVVLMADGVAPLSLSERGGGLTGHSGIQCFPEGRHAPFR